MEREVGGAGWWVAYPSPQPSPSRGEGEGRRAGPHAPVAGGCGLRRGEIDPWNVRLVVLGRWGGLPLSPALPPQGGREKDDVQDPMHLLRVGADCERGEVDPWNVRLVVLGGWGGLPLSPALPLKGGEGRLARPHAPVAGGCGLRARRGRPMEREVGGAGWVGWPTALPALPLKGGGRRVVQDPMHLLRVGADFGWARSTHGT